LLFAQIQPGNPKKPLQFSGLVLTADSNLPVPYTIIRIKNTNRGTIANIQGFFTLVVLPGETAEFSSVGYKRKEVLIPTDIPDQKYTIIINLSPDTLVFPETYIYPLPSKSKFKEAFLGLEVYKSQYEQMEENLNPQKMMSMKINMAMDGRENAKSYLKDLAIAARYNGGQTNYAQFPGSNFPVPLSIMNPFAWAEFIRDLKAGKLKDKYKDLRE
jgi:hypothetical protein